MNRRIHFFWGTFSPLKIAALIYFVSTPVIIKNAHTQVSNPNNGNVSAVFPINTPFFKCATPYLWQTRPRTSGKATIPFVNEVFADDSEITAKIRLTGPVTSEEKAEWVNVLQRGAQNIQDKLNNGYYGPNSEAEMREELALLGKVKNWLQGKDPNGPSLNWGYIEVISSDGSSTPAGGLYEADHHSITISQSYQSAGQSFPQTIPGDLTSAARIVHALVHEFRHSLDTKQPSFLEKLANFPNGETYPLRLPIVDPQKSEENAYLAGGIFYANTDPSDRETYVIGDDGKRKSDYQVAAGDRKKTLNDYLAMDLALSKSSNQPSAARNLADHQDPRNASGTWKGGDYKTSLTTGGAPKGSGSSTSGTSGSNFQGGSGTGSTSVGNGGGGSISPSRLDFGGSFRSFGNSGGSGGGQTSGGGSSGSGSTLSGSSGSGGTLGAGGTTVAQGGEGIYAGGNEAGPGGGTTTVTFGSGDQGTDAPIIFNSNGTGRSFDVIDKDGNTFHFEDKDGDGVFTGTDENGNVAGTWDTNKGDNPGQTPPNGPIGGSTDENGNTVVSGGSGSSGGSSSGGGTTGGDSGGSSGGTGGGSGSTSSGETGGSGSGGGTTTSGDAGSTQTGTGNCGGDGQAPCDNGGGGGSYCPPEMDCGRGGPASLRGYAVRPGPDSLLASKLGIKSNVVDGGPINPYTRGFQKKLGILSMTSDHRINLQRGINASPVGEGNTPSGPLGPKTLQGIAATPTDEGGGPTGPAARQGTVYQPTEEGNGPTGPASQGAGHSSIFERLGTAIMNLFH